MYSGNSVETVRFQKNFHTRKLDEITVIYGVMLDFFVIGNEDMKVFGKIKFSGKATWLPESSCLKISLRDVTFKESKLYVLANKTYDMSNHDTLTVFPYELITKFPILDGSHNMFALNALVYIGRCPDISARPTVQDYLSDVLYPVNLLENANNNQFEVDVTLHSFGKPFFFIVTLIF